MLSATPLAAGVNLGALYQGDKQEVWVDIRHNFTPWRPATQGGPAVPLTPQGYPLADASTWELIPDYPDGDYDVSYKGTATLSFSGVGKLAGQPTLGSDGLYHATLQVNHATDTSGKGQLNLKVTGLDPNHPMSDLKIITPGYESRPGQIFMDEFLENLQPFSEIRAVQWTRTIGTNEVDWSDRTTPDDFLAEGPTSVPLEEIVALANEAHKDLWINVPAMASDDYIRKMANLIHTQLDAGLNLYVEYSNETWNNAFPEYKQVLSDALANPLVTQRSNNMLAVAQQTAYKIKQIGDVFKQAFGAQAGRVRPVLAGFTISANYNQVALQFLSDHYGSPSNSIYALGIAPYVMLTKGTNTSGLTLDKMFASMNNYLNNTLPSILTSDVSLAGKFGVPVIAYEGGSGVTNQNPTKWVKAAAQSDPRMYKLYQDLLDLWSQKVGTMFNAYAYSGTFWGLLNKAQDPGSQKWDAVMSKILPAGDANLDGKVTSADLTIVQANLGKKGAWWEQGDFNHDGVVNNQDLQTVQSQLIGTESTAQFLGSDTTTGGSWVGGYGGDGYRVIGGTTSYPSYAAVKPTGASNWTWAASTNDARALQKSSTASSRAAASLFAKQFTLNLSFNDGQSHTFSLYAVDWDSTKRSERIDIVDPSSGTILDSQTISSFHNGVYLTWTVSGDVQVKVTRLAGANAVVSGIFFGAPESSPDSTLETIEGTLDTNTQGNWRGHYGTQGYNIIGNKSSYPSYASVSTVGAKTWTWAKSTSDVQALQKATNPSDRIEASWYSDSFTINLNLTDGQTHRVSLYAADWVSKGRSERIDVVDPATGQVIDTQTLSSFTGGAYVSWALSGKVQIRITRLTGPNAVVSGLFFD
jgi:hypothetical protein